MDGHVQKECARLVGGAEFDSLACPQVSSINVVRCEVDCRGESDTVKTSRGWGVERNVELTERALKLRTGKNE